MENWHPRPLGEKLTLQQRPLFSTPNHRSRGEFHFTSEIAHKIRSADLVLSSAVSIPDSPRASKSAQWFADRVGIGMTGGLHGVCAQL